MTNSLPTALARDAALLRFAVLNGDVGISLPTGTGIRAIQGTITAPDGSAMGSIVPSREGFTVSDIQGGTVAQLSVLGFSADGSALQHPAYPGTAWRDRVRQHGGPGATGSVTAESARSQSSSSDDDEFSAASSGGMPKAALLGLIGVAAAIGLAVVFAGGDSDSTDAPAATENATAQVAASSDKAPSAGTQGSNGQGSGASTGNTGSGSGDASASAATPSAGTPSAKTGAAGGSAPGDASTGSAANADKSVPAAASADAKTPAAEAGSAKSTQPSAAAPKASPEASQSPKTTAKKTSPSSNSKRTSRSGGSSSPAARGSHTMVHGESLSTVAYDLGLRGTDDISGFIEAAMRINGLGDANQLSAGETVKLPSLAPTPDWVGDLYTADEYPGF